MDAFKDPQVANRLKKFLSIRNAAINHEHLCMLPGCSEIAINSHIIQRSQFLEPIADKDGKLMSLETKEKIPGKLPRFLKVPIRSILTFKGFCRYHDQLIFSEIEKNPFDLSNNRHLALFNYRGICHELRKKQIIVKWFEGLAKDNVDFDDLSVERFNHNLDLQKLGIQDISYYKGLIENDIIQGESNFKFQVYRLPYREVVTSACFNIEELIHIDPAKINDETWRNTPLKYVTITIFPKDGELVVIFGYLIKDEKKVKEFVTSMGGISLDFVNKIILEWVETWACSDKFYKAKVEHQLEDVQQVSLLTNIQIPANMMVIPNLMEE